MQKYMFVNNLSGKEPNSCDCSLLKDYFRKRRKIFNMEGYLDGEHTGTEGYLDGEHTESKTKVLRNTLQKSENSYLATAADFEYYGVFGFGKLPQSQHLIEEYLSYILHLEKQIEQQRRYNEYLSDYLRQIETNLPEELCMLSQENIDKYLNAMPASNEVQFGAPQYQVKASTTFCMASKLAGTMMGQANKLVKHVPATAIFKGIGEGVAQNKFLSRLKSVK